MSDSGMKRRDFMKGAMASGAGLGALGLGSSAAAAEAPTKVPRKKLGTTGMEVPIILMGCSDRFDPKYDKRLHRAFARGVDYLDTAQIYANGQSHKTLAPFLQQVGRENIWVTSKVALKGTRATPENFTSNMDKCLEDLETDYLNMFFMHMIDDLRMLDPEFIKMGDTMKKSGKTKLFGFSCHDGNVVPLMNKAAEVGGIDAIMFRFNFRQYGDLELNKAIDNCKKAGIGLIAMKTQASVPEDKEEVVKFVSKDFTLGQAKLKSVWADDRIDCAVSGMKNIEQVMENTDAAMSPVQLSMNEFTQMNRLAALTAPYYCAGCNHICEAKVDGKLRIADALRYLMYHESYSDPETARMLYSALSADERDFEHVDLAEATRACPQDIQIEARLSQAKRMLMA